MNLASIELILSTIANIITIAAPIAIKAEKDAEPFAKLIYDLISGAELTTEDVNNALLQANALSKQIQNPDFIPLVQIDDV